MKVLLDIRDDKAAFLMEILRNFNFVKAKPLTPYKSDVLENVSLAVEEMNLITSGKLEARDAEEFLNEL